MEIEKQYRKEYYMKRYRQIIIILMITILLGMSLPGIVHSNAAEPPSFTIIALNPPEDLSLSLLLSDESQIEAIELDKENKAWETYYRFFYHMIPQGRDKLEGAQLVVESGEQSFQISLPTETFKTYNNLLTLDLDAESIIIGQSPLRVPILVGIRVILTLLIEGIVFYLFGFREKRSWIIFLIINLITQGGLNAMITGPIIGPYWMFGFIFGEIIILIVEMIAFISMLKEGKKSRRAIYTIAANLASLILGGILISYLPV